MAMAAALATVKKLADPKNRVYEHVRELGRILEEGINCIFKKHSTPFYLARQGSAFCLYFMDHAPRDYHDLAVNNNSELDKRYRYELIKRGIFHFPLPMKQGSISYAHSLKDIEETLAKTEEVVKRIFD
jgi:glutamate-1-semialdehyde 2,1-aminomutase